MAEPMVDRTANDQFCGAFWHPVFGSFPPSGASQKQESEL